MVSSAAKVALAVTVVAACGTGGGTAGSGTISTGSRPVAGVRAVELDVAGVLTIDQTGAESLTIEADDNILPKLTSDVVDGTLVLGVKHGERISTRKPIKYTLTVATLDGIAVNGSTTVVASGLSTDGLKVAMSGAGHMTVAGRAGSQAVTISGAGQYQADKLASHGASVDISGSRHRRGSSGHDARRSHRWQWDSDLPWSPRGHTGCEGCGHRYTGLAPPNASVVRTGHRGLGTFLEPSGGAQTEPAIRPFAANAELIRDRYLDPTGRTLPDAALAPLDQTAVMTWTAVGVSGAASP